MPAALEKTLDMQKVIELIYRFYGNISATAKALGRDRDCLTAYIHRHPETEEALKKSTEAGLDKAESVLMRAMEDYANNPREAIDAAKYLLDCKGRTRGFGKLQRIELSAEQDFTINMIAAQDPDAKQG